MRLRFTAVSIIMCIAVSLFGSVPADNPIPPDSRFRTGRLPNGLTYYIQINDLPRGQMHFVLVQKPERSPFKRGPDIAFGYEGRSRPAGSP